MDGNQQAIIDGLRNIPGVSVEPGHDDIIVGIRGYTYWYEVKTEDQRSKKDGHIKESAKTPGQKRLDETWKGHRRYVTTLEEVLEDIFLTL